MSTKIVEKPWGNELIWAITDRYVGKILHIKKGHSLSLQYHNKKDETVMVLSGKMEFVHYREGEAPKSTVLLPRAAVPRDAASAPSHGRARGHRCRRGVDDRARRRRAPRRQLRAQGDVGAVASDGAVAQFGQPLRAGSEVDLPVESVTFPVCGVSEAKLTPSAPSVAVPSSG